MTQPTPEALDAAVTLFWQGFFPFWQQVRAHIRQTCAEQFSISAEQFHILRHVRDGHTSVSELAQVKHTSRPAISQAVEALVQRGFLTRTQERKDRRQVRLSLTAQGETLLEQIFGSTRQWMMQTLAQLSAEELAVFTAGLAPLRKF